MSVIQPMLAYSNGGGSPTNPFTFTFRGDVLSGVDAYAVASDPNGNTLLVSSAGAVHISTDGGLTWTLQSTIAGFTPFQTVGCLEESNGTWLLTGVQSAGNLWRSTNLGVSWTEISPPMGTAGGLCIGAKGGGVWFGCGNVSPAPAADYGLSTDDGLTWASHGITSIGGIVPPYLALWDGAQWVLSSADTSTGDPAYWTSADGLTWTEHLYTPDTSVFLRSTLFVGGLYYGADKFSPLVWGGVNSVAGLAAAAPTSVPISNGTSFLLKSSVNFFTIGNGGDVAGSTDFSTWTLGILNLPGGELPNCACYDVTNDSIIVAGAHGSVVTFP
jgi:hypothetical protein